MKIIKQYFWLVRKIWVNGRAIFCFYIFLQLLGSLLPTIVSYIQMIFINQAENLSLHKEFSFIFLLILFSFVLINFIKSIYGYVDSYFAHKFIQKTKFEFNKILSLRMYNEKQDSFYDPKFNDTISRVNAGYNIIPFQLFSVNGLVISIVSLIIQLYFIIAYSPLLTVFMILGTVFSIVYSKRIAKKEYETDIELTRSQRKQDYYSDVLTLKPYAKEIRIFNLQDMFYKKWIKKFFHVTEKKNKVSIEKEIFELVDNFISFIIQLLALIYLFYLIYKGNMSIGRFIFLYNIFNSCLSLLKEIVQTSVGDLYQKYLNIENYRTYVEDGFVNDFKDNNYEIKKEIPVFQKLELKNVCYKYPTSTSMVLKDICFTLNKGEIVSILGYNGSGKTTLSKVITGVFQPEQGNVFLNGINYKDLSREEISLYFGIAYQDFNRYYLSVKDNIGFGYIEKYSDSLIQDSFNKVNGATLLNKLPYGYDTLLGKEFYSEGLDLSGGEWQKIALARAYMGEHEILLLDEPTASMDPMKEMNMLLHFRSILKNRTAILISHRIGFARLADRIIIMKDGKIIEQGTHDQLLDQKGHYYHLFNSQKELYYCKEGDLSCKKVSQV